MNDTLTIKKRAIADKLKEKLADKLGAAPAALPGGLPDDPLHAPQRRAGEPNRTMPPTPADDVDPLVDFLARYDEGGASSDVSGFDAAAPAEDEKRYLSFDLAGEPYAASIMDIREILKVAVLTEVPRAPREILGVLSKRGVIMPVVDLAAAIGLRAPSLRLGVEQRILVVGDGDRVCGLRVDRVREVVRLGRAAVEDVPPSLGARQAQLLAGLGKTADRMLILLDVPAVLADLAAKVGLAPLLPRGQDAASAGAAEAR